MNELELLEASRNTLSVMLCAQIFLSDGEVQTLTGFDLLEYRQLAAQLKALGSWQELDTQSLTMIHQAANTLLNVPHADEELYRSIGTNYDAILELLMQMISEKLGTA